MEEANMEEGNVFTEQQTSPSSLKVSGLWEVLKFDPKERKTV